MTHTVSKLDPKEKMKEAGDVFFKAANFEKAAVEYTKCLNSISDKVSNCQALIIENFFAFIILFPKLQYSISIPSPSPLFDWFVSFITSTIFSHAN